MAGRPPSSMARLTLLLLLSLALLFASLQAQPQPQGASKRHLGSSSSSSSSSEEEKYVPVRRVVYRRWPATKTATTTAAAAGEYEPFEVCEGCRCCAAGKGSSCVETSCCYAIDCSLPGKPYGVCAFTPRTCGCGATNCTTAQPPS
ncbi:hypothetical protein ACP4OV_014877 [Aristida adscensionis]